MSAKGILQEVRRVAHEVLHGHDVAVYLFGSWAKGEQRQSSDIDLAVDSHQPLPQGTLAILRERFEESRIPYIVDVVDLSEADEAFRAKVRGEGIRWSV